VFSEQKQLDAFVGRTPEERRKLVLQLLGITPLEKARDAAKLDANARAKEHSRLVALIPDLTAHEARLAAATAALTRASDAVTSAAAALTHASDMHQSAAAALATFAAKKQRNDELTAEGRAVRKELDRATAAVEQLTTEQARLAERAAAITALAATASTRPVLLRSVAALDRLAQALTARARLPESAPPPTEVELHQGRESVATAEHAAEAAQRAAADRQGELRSAQEVLARATAALADMAGSDGMEACPTCGQAIGADSEAARRHRSEEVQTARRAVTVATTAHRDAVSAQGNTADQLKRATAAHRVQQDALVAFAAQQRACDAAEHTVAEARLAVAELVDSTGEIVERASDLTSLINKTRSALESADQADRQLAEHRGALERAAQLGDELERERLIVVNATQRRTTLLDELRSVGFAVEAFREVEREAAMSATALEAARSADTDARVRHARSEEAHRNATAALADANTQTASLRALATETQVLGRTAELLDAFRKTMIATVGPRLATQASELFRELTGHEYDGLEVDQDRYELRILDSGVAHPISRYSGSEVDLANLALRVAISEQVRFQAGGHVGLLVLDEALASLDSDRKDRMLLALTRLAGRFRQVLVVTHAPEVKEQLPEAIEIRKLPGRRATARVVDPTAEGA
jgi:DNA repair exonuclease SbcCD ATPase subunit